MAEVGEPNGPIQVPPKQPLDVTLSWDRAEADADAQVEADAQAEVDLDIGCFYWTVEGDRGAIQSVGSADSAGSAAATGPMVGGRPLLSVATGRAAGGPARERLIVRRPADLSFLVVHASVYAGAADFRDLGARMVARSGGRTLLEVELTAPAAGMPWCAVLVSGPGGSQHYLALEERYFRSAHHADRHYNLGLRWQMGIKA